MKKSITLIFAASTLLLAGCCTTHRDHATTKWEYMKVYSIDQANQRTADGWVVAGFSAYIDSPNTQFSQTEIYLLKRPKQ
ncbi:MAG TPA: hypothetical protein VIK28_10855 [Sedimentisphaerales bacterium]|jgi:hypothetical protein